MAMGQEETPIFDYADEGALLVKAKYPSKDILNIFKENPKDKTIPYKANEERNPLIIMSLSLIAFGLIGGIVYVIKKH